MSGFFSFQKFITKPFVKGLYVLGFLALSSAAIAFTTWVIQNWHSDFLSGRRAYYYLAIGIGAVTIGNLVWRVFCEFWVVLFNIHARLVSIDRGVNPVAVITESAKAEAREEKLASERKPKRATVDKDSYGLARPSGVLGLS